MTMAGSKKHTHNVEPEDLNFFTVKETADYLRLCEKQVRRAISSGELPAYQFGTALRIHKEDRGAYVKARRVIPVNKKK